MNPTVSRKNVPDTSIIKRTGAKTPGDIRLWPGAAESVSLKLLLSSWGAVIALWAPAYLALLDRYGRGVAARTEILEWALVIVGVLGLGSVLYVAWQDTRNHAWRAAHGLPLRPRPDVPGR